MTAVALLQPPRENTTETATYVALPRAKRSFNTVLDASRIFAHDGRSTVTTKVTGEGPERRVLLQTEHPLQGGLIAETFELSANGTLIPLRLERRVLDASGTPSREETVRRYEQMSRRTVRNLRYNEVLVAVQLAIPVTRLETRLRNEGLLTGDFDLAGFCVERVRQLLD